MIMPPTRSAKPKIETSDEIDAKTLGRIEAQLDYLITGVDKLTTQFAKAEDSRASNWVEYRTAHTQLAMQCEAHERRLCSTEEEITELMSNTESAFDGAEKAVKDEFTKIREATDTRFGAFSKLITDLDNKISPLLFAHKILVWVSIVLGTSIAALLWGIFTHTIAITFAH
jgi:hypothetical protein